MTTDLFSLDGKVAIVTGSTRGIGLSIAEALCRAGATCVLSSENAAAVDEATARMKAEGLRVTGLKCDVTDENDLQRLVDCATGNFGGLDILVCNAGVTGTSGPVTEILASDYQRVFDINLYSMVKLANLAHPQLKVRGGGSVILMSSISALRGNARINAYALAKAGVAQLARNLAVQWGPDNIRTNAIAPGLIRTELSRPLLEDTAFMNRRMQMTPLGRPGEKHEVAGCAVFLASRAGAFINGQTIVVDGGTTITDGG